MKTFLNRSDLYRFERLVSKLVKPTELPATISFAPCSDGLQFAAFCDAAVLTLTVPSNDAVNRPSATDPFTLPWTIVKEFATKKNDDIGLDVNDKTVSLSWNVNGIPQQKSVPSLGLTDKRPPAKQDNTITHSIALFDALQDAAKCVDAENTRYSLGSICLRGSKAQIVSTDGRQALIQDGFSFSWENDVLCPVTKIFGAKELRELGDTVKVGFEDHWIFFQVGNVSLWLKEIDGKFPQLDQFTKNIDHFTWLNVDPTDTVFVSDRLDNLPGKADRESPIYIHLNNGVAVRGHDQVQQTATELRMEKSRYDGSNVTMPVNRKFLKNALNLGVARIGFDPKDRTPLIGYGERKTFIVMPLEGDEPKVEVDKLTVLSSNVKATLSTNLSKAVKTKTNAPVATVVAKCVRPIEPLRQSNEQMDVIAASEGLCQTLADTLRITRRLVRNLKQQRKQNRLMRATIASLRELQNV